MLLTKTVLIQWTGNNREFYENRGYVFTKYKKYFEVNTQDLSPNSHIKIKVLCDCIDCENKIPKDIIWRDYHKYIIKNNGLYYCRKCAIKLYGNEKGRITRLKNSKTFKQWCIENNRQDILDRWDYELNDYKPSEISYRTNKKYYFKCSRNLHESELKDINGFVRGQEGSMYCKACNSLAQWGIDNLGEGFLEKYWDYKKNTVNPWMIPKFYNNKIFIKCQENKQHDSYVIVCGNFSFLNQRCPLCNNSKGESIIEKWLRNNNINHISQKTFNSLIGINNGLLSYDFFLPNHNLLIEYQGEQHEKYIPGFHKSKKDFKKQLEHDKRKREYADKNNIKLLEIWYWDFDNIEKILEKEI